MNSQCYINSYDWTESVVQIDSVYYDGNAAHEELLQCHEAESCDYGVQNPFLEVAPSDLKLFASVAEDMWSQLELIAPVTDAAYKLVCHLRHVLPRQTKVLDAKVGQADSFECRAYTDIVKRFADYCFDASWGWDEPTLVVYLKRSRSISRVAKKMRLTESLEPETRQDLRFYQSVTNPLQLAVLVDGTCYELGHRVDAIHKASYRAVTPHAASWLLALGEEIRDGWSEAKNYFGWLKTIGENGNQFQMSFAHDTVQILFDRLVEEASDHVDELFDYITSLEMYRSDSVRSARTVRLAAKKRGHGYSESLFEDACSPSGSPST